MARVPLSDALYQDILNSQSFRDENFANAQKQGREPHETQRDTAEKVYKTFYKPNGTPKIYNRMTNRAGGPKAKFLESIGLREPGATYPVGGSPRKRR